MAVAEAGGGYDGNVTKAESKSILSRLARGGDPAQKIKSLELLNKLEREEQEFRSSEPEETLEDALAWLILSVRTQGVGSLFALESFVNAGGAICNFPFLKETAPIVAKYFPAEWGRWRSKEPDHWRDFLDKMASGPFLEDAALVEAIERKMPANHKPKKEFADA